MAGGAGRHLVPVPGVLLRVGHDLAVAAPAERARVRPELPGPVGEAALVGIVAGRAGEAAHGAVAPLDPVEVLLPVPVRVLLVGPEGARGGVRLRSEENTAEPQS